MNPCVSNTPVEQVADWLWVKREDLCCPGGPNFSKMRGVYVHLERRPEPVIGVLDSYHSQAGHAVARACQVLGKRVVNFYPDFVKEPGPRAPQLRAQACGAELIPLEGRLKSSVLWYKGRKALPAGAYMMPNGLQLAESVAETWAEVLRTRFPVEYDTVVVAASSGTIAKGVVTGFLERPEALLYEPPLFIVHAGYTKHTPVPRDFPSAARVDIVDEGYSYRGKARAGSAAPFPCSEYYDLKAFRYLMDKYQRRRDERILFWNIG